MEIRNAPKIKDKRRGLDMAVLNHPIKSPNTSWKLGQGGAEPPDQLAKHILEAGTGWC